jgi:hypothetical protein
VAFFVELFWWPKWRDAMLANGDRAADIAAHMLQQQGAERTDL